MAGGKGKAGKDSGKAKSKVFLKQRLGIYPLSMKFSNKFIIISFFPLYILSIKLIMDNG